MKFSLKKIAIQIPEPCQENWNEMSQAEQGRFCSLCQKTVMDFSQMTDNEIVRYFKNHSEQKTCGHFKTTQVNRPIKVPNRLEEWYWQVEMKYKEGFLKKTYLFLLSGMLLLVGCDNPEKDLAYRKEKLEIQIDKMKKDIELDNVNNLISKIEGEKAIRILEAECKKNKSNKSVNEREDKEKAAKLIDLLSKGEIMVMGSSTIKPNKKDTLKKLQKELLAIKKSNSLWTWLMDKLR